MTLTAIFLILIFVNDVRAAGKDGVETVEVTEGVNVTLRTNLTGISSDDTIRWTFGTPETRIAQLVNGNIVKYYNETLFQNRLQLDNKTGSLNISNIRTNDSGPYKIQISGDQVKNIQYDVTVYATLRIPALTPAAGSPKSSVVCSVRNGYKVTLSWFRGSSPLSSTSDTDNSTLSLHLDIECCDNNPYSCVAANPITNQTAHLNTTIYCLNKDCTDKRSINVISIVIGLAVVIVLLLALCLFIRRLRESHVISSSSLDLSIIDQKMIDFLSQIETFCTWRERSHVHGSNSFHSTLNSRRDMWIYYLLSLCFSRIHLFLLLHLVFLHDVKAVVKDGVETVEGTEGGSVTLSTDLTGVKSDDVIRWTFGATYTRLAQLLSRNTFTDYNERFKTRLQLDPQTGSLTISNIRTSDSGPYKVLISRDQVTNKHFNVTVYATLPVPDITQKTSQSQSQSKSSSGPRCFAVCSVSNAYKVTLSWYNGRDLLSSIGGSENSILSLPLDFDHCDNNTYICVAANPITNRTAQLNMSCTWSRAPNDVRAAVKDGVKTVEVTEGATVTLRTDLTAVNSNYMIAWTFGASNTRIAHLTNKAAAPYYNGIFSDRLHLDTQTGSLTISNIRTNDSGPYKVQIISDQGSEKHFNVTVYATLPIPTLTPAAGSPRCSVVCSVRNGYKVTLSWFNRSYLLSTTSDTDSSTLSRPLDIECCDNNPYSCVAANPITNQTAHLNTTTYCLKDCTDKSSVNVHNIVIGPAVVIVLLLALYLFIQKRQNEDVRAAVKDGVETVEVTEGATVTLRTDLTAVNSNDVIVWTFVTTDTRIAQLANKAAAPIDNEIFSDRLHLDTQTGSLNISNIRTNDSGPYKVQIIRNKGSEKHFNVTVYATLPVPDITQKSSQSQSQTKSSSGPRCSAVCSVSNAYKVTLSWYNGSNILSSFSGSDKSILSLPLDFEHGDNNTYICVAANPITNRTAQLNTSCTWSRSPNDSSRLLQWLIPVLVVLLLVLVTLYLLYRKKAFSKNTQEA
ncbi:hypothetical protein NFI96_026633 [Prochilodus magdalenae]|nr:hypothetical protein NFI96_026633 [Prochilodus magdalenae]